MVWHSNALEMILLLGFCTLSCELDELKHHFIASCCVTVISDGAFELVALEDLEKGQHVTISYSGEFLFTAHLFTFYAFFCVTRLCDI